MSYINYKNFNIEHEIKIYDNMSIAEILQIYF